jgi:hypothetical protein
MQEGENITWMYTYKKEVAKKHTHQPCARTREKMTPMPKIEEKKRKNKNSLAHYWSSALYNALEVRPPHSCPAAGARPPPMQRPLLRRHIAHVRTATSTIGRCLALDMSAGLAVVASSGTGVRGGLLLPLRH